MGDHFDVVIAGGGIAGLSAALMAARLGRTALVLTGDVLGGHLLSIEKIEGYPGFPDGIAGYDLCPMTQEQAVEAGSRIVSDNVVGLGHEENIWTVTAGRHSYSAGAVIVATGTTFKELGIPGEQRLRGKGVSQCASCDAPLLRGRPVAVVGGGDSALQEASTLAAAASRVTIFHRGDGFSAQAGFRDRVAANGRIDVQFGTVVEEILGDEVVNGVRIRRLADDKIEDYPVDGIFIYVGLRPNSTIVAGHSPLDGSGAIVTDGAMRAAAPGLLAAGTVRSGAPGRAVAAAGEGTAAAIAADGYLADGTWCKMETGGSR